MLKNRAEAGKLLAEKVSKFKNENGIIIGLPRGGVVVAKEIANKLNWPLDVFISKKITPLQNPEYAIAAITETKHLEQNEQIISSLTTLDTDFINKQLKWLEDEIERRKVLFRKGKNLIVAEKTVILVDDGIATGLTLLAAIKSLKKLGAKKIILAIGVVPQDTIKNFSESVDDFIFLESSNNFFSVGQFYEDFLAVTDDEVIKILYNK
jgi:putative phosphoribosyl transferase